MSSKRELVFNIDEHTNVTIRDLSPGEHFIHTRDFRRHRHSQKMLLAHLLVRTDDPFKSTTLLGTPIMTYPSEHVHRATRITAEEESTS